MADLHWFPFFAGDWLSSPARMAMLPEQRGAYIDLLAVAWGDGSAEPSLDADDRKLAAQSGLGARWKRLGTFVRDQFTERDGRLYNAKLSSVWHESQQRHGKAVVRASAGGKAKADNRRAKNHASDLLEADAKQPASSACGVLGECLQGTQSEPELQTTILPPPAAEPISPRAVTIWANGATTERWGEQANPYFVNGHSQHLSDALIEAGVDPESAKRSIYRQCQDSKEPRPFKTVWYFRLGALDDWKKDQMRAAGAGERPPVKVPRGATTIGVADTRGDWLWGLYRVHGMTRNVPKSERERVGEELVTAGHFPSVEAFLDEMRITQPWTLEDARSDRWAAEMINSRLLSAAGKVA